MHLLANVMSAMPSVNPVTAFTTFLAYGNDGGNGGLWTTSAPSVSTPNSIGDLLVSVQVTRGTPQAPATPSGFTNFLQTNGSYYSINASYKIATANNETVNFTAYNQSSVVVVRATPNGTITTVTPNSVYFAESGTQVLTRTIPLSSATYPVLAIATGFDSNNAKNISSFPNMTYGIYFDSINFQNLLSYNIYNTSPGDIATSVQPDGINMLSAFYLSVA